jgi:fimbrial isopeptide formation D2 family protein
VTIVGTAFTATTDSNGIFSMSGVPDGTYTVRATSSFGDVLSEQTVTVTNSDANNVVFQARPRITLTKTASTAGPVLPGDQITYTLTLQNVGNFPAFQVSNLSDTLVKGLGTATLVSASYNGTSVTSSAGFSFSQSAQTISATVRNSSNEPRLNVGDIYSVSYTVTVQSSLKLGSLTIPNSAELASYTTSATTTATTESYVDIRCGEVRLETASSNPECSTTDLSSTIDALKARIARIKDGVAKAIALRKQYVKAGYCKAADNGCFKCAGSRSRCINTCRPPSATEDRALLNRAKELSDSSNQSISNDLYSNVSELVCSGYMSCSMVDVASVKDSIESAGRRLSNDMRDVLDSCCMRTARAVAALKQRRASLKQAAKLDQKRLSNLMAEYPSPGLVCQ